MAWNKSSEGAAPAKTKTRPSPIRGLVAGAVVVALSLVCYFLFWGEDTAKPKPKVEKEAGLIKEVKPAAAPKYEEKPVEMVTNRHGKVVPKRRAETYKDERGVLRYKIGNGRVPLPDAHKYLVKSREYKDNMPQFKHQVETEIAAILIHQPGDAVIGDFPHDRAFKKDFVAALMEPIEILETDSEEDKKLKMDVEQTKHDLAQRLKNGEDVGEILQEARDEMRRASVYKNDVMQMVREQIATENPQSTVEIDTYYEAMNKMLESKGIEPVKMSGLMRRKIGYDLMKAREDAAKQDGPVPGNSGN